MPSQPLEPTPEPADRGVVLLVEHDRERLQQLDVQLSARGYTVVSMTRALGQLSRLARALRPRAILLELASEGVADVVAELRAGDAVPVLVFTRERAPANPAVSELLELAADADLVSFVENQS
jgi:DNA-binding response OmpR family regulator